MVEQIVLNPVEEGNDGDARVDFAQPLCLAELELEARNRQEIALQTMNYILGGQFTSRINLNLREDKGYTYGARSSFSMRRSLIAVSSLVAIQQKSHTKATGAPWKLPQLSTRPSPATCRLSRKKEKSGSQFGT